MKPPLSVHESLAERLRIRAPDGKVIADPALDTLAGALRAAREHCERLASLADAVAGDVTMPPAARALKIRTEALRLGESAGGKLDAARQKLAQEINAILSVTSAPPPPKDVLAMQLESECRARLTAMPEKQRDAAIADAIKRNDPIICGALLRGPAMLSGLTEVTLDMRRDQWRRQQFPTEVGREERLRKGAETCERAGKALVAYIAELSTGDGAERVDAAARRATEALADAQAAE